MNIITEEKLLYFLALYEGNRSPEEALKEIEDYQSWFEEKYIYNCFKEFENIQNYYTRKLGSDIKNSEYYLSIGSEKTEIKSILDQLNDYSETLKQLSDELRLTKYGTKKYRSIEQNINVISKKGKALLGKLDNHETEIQRISNVGKQNVEVLSQIQQKLKRFSKRQNSFLVRNLKYAFMNKKIVRVLNILFLLIFSYLLESLVSPIAVPKIGGVTIKNFSFGLIFIIQIFIIDPNLTSFRNSLIWNVYRKRIDSLKNIERIYDEFQDELSLVKKRIKDFQNEISHIS